MGLIFSTFLSFSRSSSSLLFSRYIHTYISIYIYFHVGRKVFDGTYLKVLLLPCPHLTKINRGPLFFFSSLFERILSRSPCRLAFLVVFLFLLLSAGTGAAVIIGLNSGRHHSDTTTTTSSSSSLKAAVSRNSVAASLSSSSFISPRARARGGFPWKMGVLRSPLPPPPPPPPLSALQCTSTSSSPSFWIRNTCHDGFLTVVGNKRVVSQHEGISKYEEEGMISETKSEFSSHASTLVTAGRKLQPQILNI